MSEQAQVLKAKRVTFPRSHSFPEQSCELECQTSIVVVGANGAGKSRLGAWLEFHGPQKKSIRRITAEKSLVFPDTCSPVTVQAAQESFHWAPKPASWDDKGYENNKESLRVQARYGGPVGFAETAPVNDFSKLLTLLFSDNYNTLLEHEAAQRLSDVLIPIPETLLHRVQTLWELVLPHRKLKILAGEVRAAIAGDSVGYPARSMSDGERVVFYLAGQCLCAADNAIIVVDEPEIHLHKAIQNKLWNEIEKARPDCTFVYLTHDLAFAADRVGSTKVCLRDHVDGKFSWFAIAAQEDIPEDVYLEVLGSRKPVLFVEGTHGSHDLEVYQMAYPQFTVRPVGSCSAVLVATKAFRSLSVMHHIECFGIVDRDYLQVEQLAAYERNGVYAPLVAEVENLYLIPKVVSAVAEQLLLNASAVLNRVEQYVLEEFERGMPVHTMQVTRHKVALAIGQFSSTQSEIGAYADELRASMAQVDARAIHEAADSEANAVLASGDYESVLRIFNKKALAKNVDRFFDIKKSTYIEKVREMAKREINDIPSCFMEFLPDLAGKLSQQLPLSSEIVESLLPTLVMSKE